MDWSPQAQRAWAALVRRLQPDGYLRLTDAIVGVATGTLPGDSALGRVLRNPDVWPHGQEFARLSDQEVVQRGLGTGLHPYTIEVEVESAARREGARRVGERHIAAVLAARGDYLQRMLLNPDRLVAAVRELEVGPAFAPEHIRDRWHGLIDANIVIHYRDVWNLNWREVTGAACVTVWVSAVLLDELDDMKYTTNRQQHVVSRARAFTRWFGHRLERAIEPSGFEIRPNVALRAWSPSLAAGAPDGRHLEVAEALLDRQVPIHMVTADTGQQLRARLRWIPVFNMPDECLLHEDKSPSSP